MCKFGIPTTIVYLYELWTKMTVAALRSTLKSYMEQEDLILHDGLDAYEGKYIILLVLDTGIVALIAQRH